MYYHDAFTRLFISDCNFITFLKVCGIIHLAAIWEIKHKLLFHCFWPTIHYRLSASLPVMTTPHTVVSQHAFVTIDTFLSLQRCNAFQAGAKIRCSWHLTAGTVHNSSFVLNAMPGCQHLQHTTQKCFSSSNLPSCFSSNCRSVQCATAIYGCVCTLEAG